MAILVGENLVTAAVGQARYLSESADGHVASAQTCTNGHIC